MLKRSIEEEAQSLQKQAEQMRQRKQAAATSLEALAAARARLSGGCPACGEKLGQQALAYKREGKLKQASLLFVSAIKLLQATGHGSSAQMVLLFSELADLYTETGMPEEGVALYKQAYSLEKEVSGHESPMLAMHLKKLGSAYEMQGKMEAAGLTLEEALHVLETAHGPDHPEVLALRQRLSGVRGAPPPTATPGGSAPPGVVSLGMPVHAQRAEPGSDDAGAVEVRASQMPRKELGPNSGGGTFRGTGGAAGATLPRPANMPVPKVPGLAIGGSGQPGGQPAVAPDDLQNFSSQRMRARLEARQKARERQP